MSIVIKAADFREVYEATVGAMTVRFTRDAGADAASAPAGFFQFICDEKDDKEDDMEKNPIAVG